MKNVLKFAALLYLIPISSYAEVCQGMHSQHEFHVCLADDYKREDALLNKAYGELKSKVTVEQSNALKTVQLSWIKFRDLACEFEGSLYGAGSGAPLAIVACKRALTIERRKGLENTPNI